jgi:hypothetical protein
VDPHEDVVAAVMVPMAMQKRLAKRYASKAKISTSVTFKSPRLFAARHGARREALPAAHGAASMPRPTNLKNSLRDRLIRLSMRGRGLTRSVASGRWSVAVTRDS